MKQWVPIVAAILFAYPVFLFVRMIFVAPFQLNRELKKEISGIQDELNALILKNNKGASDTQPLLAAINYIQEHTAFGKRKTYAEVFDELTRLVIGSSIEIKGQRKGPYSKIADSYTSKVELKAQSLCTYENYGDLQTLALVVTEEVELSRGDSQRRLGLIAHMLGQSTLTTIYYNPVISMSEIKRHFAD